MTVKISKLQDRVSGRVTKTVPEQGLYNLEDGMCHAWVFNDNPPSVSDGYNVSSVSDLGVGDYRPNFTNRFEAADACIASGFSLRGAAQYLSGVGAVFGQAGSIRVNLKDDTGTVTDGEFTTAAWGRLA